MSPLPAWVTRGATILGFALLLLVGFLYVVSGLVVPQPWLTGLWVFWVVLALYAVRHRTTPWRVLVAPVVGILVWLVFITVGGALLDWTA